MEIIVYLVLAICYFRKKEKTMKELGILILVVVAWFVLNRYILPKMGVST